MSITKTLFDTSRQVPENEEEGWGGNVTGQLGDLLDGADRILLKSGSNVLTRSQAASNTLAGGATLTQTAPVHRVQGSGGAVTLSATTPIAAGVKDGQELEIEGDHATNTVTIPGSSNTTALNGDAVLAKYHVLRLRWHHADGKWIERGRSH